MEYRISEKDLRRIQNLVPEIYYTIRSDNKFCDFLAEFNIKNIK